MKRITYIVLAVIVLLCGCEYHPYYDGQKFRIYNNRHGLIEADGTHMYVPLVDKRKFVIDVYGGKGRNHSIVVDDPKCLSYTYEAAKVDGGLLGDGIIPTRVTINPLEVGDTSIRISDDDTGESIQVFIHVVKAYSTMEVYKTHGSMQPGIVFAFEYRSKNDVVKICRFNEETYEIDFMYDARYKFLDYDTTVAFELTYLADADGQPDAAGNETVKRFLVLYEDGGDSGYPFGMLREMNLNYLPITRAYYPDEDYEYYQEFIFVDITDDEKYDLNSPETKYFHTSSAQINMLSNND